MGIDFGGPGLEAILGQLRWYCEAVFSNSPIRVSFQQVR